MDEQPVKRKPGRQPGSKNKTTQRTREAIAKFCEANAGRMQRWLDQVAKDDPEKAFGMLKDLLEYHVPKLARTEVTGKDGGAVQVDASVKLSPEDAYKQMLGK